MSASRRSFLQSCSAVGAGALFSTAASYARAMGSAERVRVGVIGTGGQGRAHLASYHGLKDAELAYVSDTDGTRLAAAAKQYGSARPTGDFRHILDDKTIDAVSIATPDHWHTPAALLAMKAGKHVYVEKPCSHNVREGQLLVAAAKKYDRVVQHGTQTRSSRFFADAVQMLREGIIGDVLVARAWNIQRRGNIGHKSPSTPPGGVNYQTWIGPAPFLPYQSNRFHYNWHWWYNFGTGDAGNDGVHEIDLARWGLGVDTQPARISAVGGKYFHDDDQQFPDTITATFEYPGNGKVGNRKQLIFEMRLWSTNYPFNVDSGVEFMGTKGKLFVSKRGKYELLGERNKRRSEKPDAPIRVSVSDHQNNFIQAIRSGQKLNADAQTGHLSSSLSHFANIATRLGRSIQLNTTKEAAIKDAQADALLGRTYRDGHWAVPKV